MTKRNQQQDESRLLRTLVDEYLEDILGSVPQSTVDNYRCCLRRVMRCDFAVSIDDVDHEYLDLVCGKLVSQLSGPTLSWTMDVFQAFLNWCRKAGLIETNPMMGYQLPEKPPAEAAQEGVKMIPQTGPKSLGRYFELYVTRRPIQPPSANNLRCACWRLIEFVGHHPDVDEVDEDLLSSWILALESEIKPRTIIMYRSAVVSLLRMAADDGVRTEPRMRKIRRPKKPKPLPDAWTPEELRSVVCVCDNLDGEIFRNGSVIPVCVYFGCLIRVAYETGLRKGNLWRLKQSDVQDNGTVYVRHEKTGEPHVCSIGESTLKLFRTLPGKHPLMWKNGRTYYRRWKRICEVAGVPQGSLHQIRKTAATSVWLEDESNPSRVQQFLGHLTPDMWRHYVDRSKGVQRPPKPSRPEFF